VPWVGCSWQRTGVGRSMAIERVLTPLYTAQVTEWALDTLWIEAMSGELLGIASLSNMAGTARVSDIRKGSLSTRLSN